MDKYEMRTFVQVNIALKIRSVTKRKLIPLHYYVLFSRILK